MLYDWNLQGVGLRELCAQTRRWGWDHSFDIVLKGLVFLEGFLDRVLEDCFDAVLEGFLRDSIFKVLPDSIFKVEKCRSNIKFPTPPLVTSSIKTHRASI